MKNIKKFFENAYETFIDYILAPIVTVIEFCTLDFFENHPILFQLVYSIVFSTLIALLINSVK